MGRSTLLLTACLLSVLAGNGVLAQTSFEVDIPAQPVGDALNQFAEQSGLQVVLYADDAEGVETPAVAGTFEDSHFVLDALLASTGLEYEFINERTVAVNAVADDTERSSDRGNRRTASSPTSTGQAPTSNDGDSAEELIAAAVESAAAGKPAEELEEIVVTGSRLVHDPGKLTRQITVFNRDEIERSGATRLDEFLQRLPQNVNAPNNVGSGFAPPGIGEPTFGLGDNVFAGSSINLRGLGSQYTLILINGRRPARGGQFGAITDISNIPIDRIERIEILFDGAAAIYGADAVGGVVNIITNREFEGTSVAAAYSDTEDGGGARYNLQLGRTFNWDSGSLTASVTYQAQDQIDGAARPNIVLDNNAVEAVSDDLYLPPSVNGNVRGNRRSAFVDGEIVTSFAPLMWVNGDQRLSAGVEVPALRLVTTDTGVEFVETTTIVSRQNPVLGPRLFWIDEAAHRPQDPATLGFTPVFQADLPQYGGQPLGLADVSTSGQLGDSVFIPFEGQAISPEDETYSIALNLRQDFSDNLSSSLSLAYTDTYKASNNLGNDTTAIIPADSPSNPFRQNFDYSFQNQFPQQFQEVSVKGYNVSGGIGWDFADDWTLAFGFGISELENESDITNFLRVSGVGPDNLDARLRGYYSPNGQPRQFTGSSFNDPLLGYGSIDEMTEALVVPFVNVHNHSESYDADIRLQGSLFRLPGGDVRTSLSLRYREDKAEIFDNSPLASGNFQSPLGSDALDYEERFGASASSVGAEFSVPVFGNDFKLPLVDRLLLSMSGTLEDYSNTDEDGFNWAAGLNWSLTEEFVIRLNRTFSLRVPDSVRTAREPRWMLSNFYDLYINVDDLSPAIRVNEPLWRIEGGANHLEPERNYGTALAFIYRPSFAEGLDIQLSISESHTVDQLGNPSMGRWTLDTVTPDAVRDNPLFAFGDPANNPFHAAATGEVRDPVTGQILPDPALIQPGDLIFDAREYNIGDTFNRGADLQIRYNLNTDFGDWMLTWRHQYLDVNEVTRTNLCEQVEVGCTNVDFAGRDRGWGEPIDTVGEVSRSNFTNWFALPRNRGTVELFWGYRGLGVTLVTQYVDTTSVTKTETQTEFVVVDYIEFGDMRFPVLEEQTSTNILREETTPERALDMTVSYDFGQGALFDAPPRWLENASISLAVSGLYVRDRKQEVVYLQQEFELPNLVDVNRLAINPRGRGYSLRFATTF